jgi:hypothetical protein
MKEGRISHRERKNGAMHEVWMKRKATANAARGRQVWVYPGDAAFEKGGWVRVF